MSFIPRVLPALFLLLTATVAAPAQIIYQPVQYQYGQQSTFYYGGSDPRVIARAEAPIDAGGHWGRVNGDAFVSGDVSVHREVTDEPLRVYSDAIPTLNAAIYGYTVTDAHNAAYAQVSRYFRKADVVAAAKATSGLLIVPANATFTTVKAEPSPAGSVERLRPVLIVPKAAIRPTTAPSDKFTDALH